MKIGTSWQVSQSVVEWPLLSSAMCAMPKSKVILPLLVPTATECSSTCVKT